MTFPNVCWGNICRNKSALSFEPCGKPLHSKTLGLLMGWHAVSKFNSRKRFQLIFCSWENILLSSDFSLQILGQLKPLLTLSGSFVFFFKQSTDSQSLQQIWESGNKTSLLSVVLTLVVWRGFFIKTDREARGRGTVIALQTCHHFLHKL